jgi:hypothetical protein
MNETVLNILIISNRARPEALVGFREQELRVIKKGFQELLLVAKDV